VSNLQTHWSATELLATDIVAEPLVAGDVRCHGGFDAAGEYVSPRTRFRVPAIRAWQQAHRDAFGTELLDVPLESWPPPYPNVAQAKFLLARGVRDPIAGTLTRIGTVEGFGGLIRAFTPGDLQPCFVESIDGTCLAHLARGLFEAQARDEAGYQNEGGHRDMWFAARDIAFEDLDPDALAATLQRMGLPTTGAAPSVPPPAPPALFPDIDSALERMTRFMIGLLFIELSAFLTFAWAEAVLSDRELVAGDGEAARVVSYVRRDEAPHVEYLKTALTEMRDRTWIGASGRHYAGTDIVGRMWDTALDESRTTRRPAFLRVMLGEVEHAVAHRRDRAELLEQFHALGTAARV
jgi:hypothetical protein